ncbi:MAG: nucleotidyltransferase domain-containing protein [Chloroflexi bacterium]|nr:MAG: nucleotidyltransferase domain-containing protein [Chloroflexota bacterium]
MAGRRTARVVPGDGEAAARRARALAVAEACATLLQERFGARRVILFGSLAGQGPWHEASDIDLAVEGLPPERFFAAYSACRDLLPADMELDLVPLEAAYPEMRARILGDGAMPEDPLVALRALVEDELTALERVAERVDEALHRFSGADSPAQLELQGLASSLHQFYTGVESIFERIAVYLDERLPRGAHWHADLLDQMAEPERGKRPAVIDEALRVRLGNYLSFRHFFRHAYGYTLEWHRMRWEVENLRDTLERLRERLHRFFEELASQEGEDEGD